MAFGTFQLTMAVPRRSTVPATMLSGHCSHGGSVSNKTQEKKKKAEKKKRMKLDSTIADVPSS